MKNTNEVSLGKLDDVVGALPSERTNDTRTEQILPRAARSTNDFFDIKCLEFISKDFAIKGIAITVQSLRESW